MALLAELLKRIDGEQQRLIVLDPKVGQPRHHFSPTDETLVPAEYVALTDIKNTDVVIGLDPGLHWWSTRPLN